MSASIGSISQLVVVIRAELAGKVLAATGKKASKAKLGDPTRRYADENIASLIGTRIANIATDDPQRGRKAFRVFLEVVLVSEFGEVMLNDPQFHQLLDDVHAAMDADPACSPLIGSAITHLVNEKP